MSTLKLFRSSAAAVAICVVIAGGGGAQSVPEIAPTTEPGDATVADAAATATEAPSAPTPISVELPAPSPLLYGFRDQDSVVFVLAAPPAAAEPVLDGVAWRTKSIEDAMKSADIVVFESDGQSSEAAARAAAIIQRDGFLVKAASLRRALGAEDSARLDEVAGAYALPADQLDRMRPWQAFLAVSMSIAAEGRKPETSGFVGALKRDVAAQGKRVAYLESIEEELALFTGMPAADEMALLRRLVSSWQDEKAARGPLAVAWMSGDAEALDRLLNEPVRSAAPKAHERLVDQRNETFANLALRLLERPGNAFVVIGARHLVGDESVPKLLAGKGVTVSKISTGEKPAATATEVAQ